MEAAAALAIEISDLKNDFSKLKLALSREKLRANAAEKSRGEAEQELGLMRAELVKLKSISVAIPTRDSAEVAKAHKAKEQYRKEAESLRRQLDSFDPEKFLEVGERARAAEENLEKTREEVARLARLVKEYERAEKAAEEEKKEDPTILRLSQLQAELAAVSKENKKLLEAKNALDRQARERAAATEKVEKNVDIFKSKAAAAAASAAAADARSKLALQAQADMQVSLLEAKKEAAAAKAEAAAATKKLDALDRKRALGDADFAILETESLDDNPEALKHKCARHTSNVIILNSRITRLEVLFRARTEDRKRAAREIKEVKASAEAQVRVWYY